MAAELTFAELLRATAALVVETKAGAERGKQLAAQADRAAQDTGRIADQIATLHVDPATIAETRELSNIMRGLSQASIAYANTSDETHRAAAAAEQQTRTDHAGINEAVQSAPIPTMAARGWYTQE